jgi:hypothetical protein
MSDCDDRRDLTDEDLEEMYHLWMKTVEEMKRKGDKR